MKNERLSAEYDEYEPEVRTWPYVLLALIVPFIPLMFSLIIYKEFSWMMLSLSIVATLPLLFTAYIAKTGDKPWLLIISGGLYFVVELVFILSYSFTSSVFFDKPIALLFSPMLLSFIAYAFYKKRKRENWIGMMVISLVLSLVFSYLSYRYGSWLSALYPMILVVLSLSICLVTRRSDSIPYFFAFFLILLVLSSFTFTGRGGIITNILLTLLNLPFWYNLLFFFVFALISGKTSYRKIISEDDDVVSLVTHSEPTKEEKRPDYTYPPEINRYGSGDNQKKEERREEPKPQQENHDKWYEFIEGSVRDDRRRIEDDDRRRRDERDYDRRNQDYDRRDYDRRDDREYYDSRDYDRDYRRCDDRDYRRRDDRRYDYDRRGDYSRDDRRRDDYPPRY